MSELAFPPAPNVAGTSLDGTKIFTISLEENAALCRSTGVEPASDGSAHPIYYYIATQVAMGKTVAGVCETCEFDVEEGPMMGSSGVKFTEQLMVGESYKFILFIPLTLLPLFFILFRFHNRPHLLSNCV